MEKVYLALYKGKGNWVDKIIRFFTKGKYSHCELAVERHKFYTGERLPEISYDCYSSSPRDGGVRRKTINVQDNQQWDLILLPNVNPNTIYAYFSKTKGQKYDFWGAIGVVLGMNHDRQKFFCSEWCWQALKGGEQGWRFSPNLLAEIAKGKMA